MKAIRFFVLLSLLASVAAPAFGEAVQPWNQEEVLAAAKQLKTAVKDVRLKIRQDPAAQLPSKAQARDDLLRKLRVLDSSTTQLVKRLEGGAGREDTLNIAKKIRTQVKDIQVGWRKLATTETSDAATEPASEALATLGPYYFGVEGSTGE